MNSTALTLYTQLLERLGESPEVARCMTGEVRPPLLGFSAPPKTWGFPPALAPVWSEGSGPWLYGYWHHWFVERRPTYVQYSVEDNLVTEVGRSFHQLVGTLALRDVSASDALEDACWAFLTQTGFPDIDSFEELAVGGGDDAAVLAPHPAFAGALPLGVVREGDEYRGDFPRVRGPHSLSNACSLELDPEALSRGLPPEAPAWLREDRPAGTFERCLANGDWGGAWLSLNCRGWAFRDAHAAIRLLAARAQHEAFSAWAEAWVSATGDEDGDY